MPTDLEQITGGSADPALIPHLARTLPSPQLPLLLDVAEQAGGDAVPAWPRLLPATCSIVAGRIRDSGDKATVDALLRRSTTLYSYVGRPRVDSAVGVLRASVDEIGSVEWAERICRLSARYPNHEGGVLVDMAASALLDLAPGDALAAGAHFLALAKDALRAAIVDAWLQTDRYEPDALQALIAAADTIERKKLTKAFLARLDRDIQPAAAVSLVSVLLPFLPESDRSRVLAQLAEPMQLVANTMPPWWTSLAWSRIRAFDFAVDVDLDAVDPWWRDRILAFDRLPQESGFEDVMRAHPSATGESGADSGVALSAGQSSELLTEMSTRWLASGTVPVATPAATASSPIATAPEMPADVASVPPPRGGLLGALLGRKSASRGGGGGAPGTAAPPGGGLLGGIFRRKPAPRGGGRESAAPPPGGGLLGRMLRRRKKPEPKRRSAKRSLPPERADEPQRDRRLQADVRSAGGDESKPLTRAFVAGTRHTIDLSVGRGASLRLDQSFAEPEFSEDREAETLQLVFIYDNTTTAGTVELPRDGSLDSGVWSAAMDVPADADNVEATVAVLHNGRVLQAAKLSGPVAPTLSAALKAEGAIEFEVVADVHNFANLDSRNAFDASVLTDGKSGAAFAGAKIGVRELSGVDDTIRKLTEKLFKATEAVAIDGDGGDPKRYEKLLVFLAAHGKVLHSVLIKQLMPSLDDAKRIQIVSSNPSAILPLEFVYSGPSPTHTASLCDGWREALENGVCTSCTEPARGERSPTVCPVNFWALSKIIERHAPVIPTAGSTDFLVGTRVAGTRDRLTPLTRALFAASDNVPEMLVDKTLAVLGNAAANCESAADWSEWATSVQARSPTLLVSMPHNAVDPLLDVGTLEIGAGSELRAGEISREHVCPENADVGPVVLLLGCQTAHGGPQPFHTFVGEFRTNGAAIVIGTLATILGEHAAPVAEAIIQELAKPMSPDENTFGDLLLRIRRNMFSRGILIALAVAAFGDADWELAPKEG